MASPAALLGAGWPDFRGLGWAAAFDRLIDTLAGDYPYTAHRRVDWGHWRRALGPRVAAAERAEDTSGYFGALRDLVLGLRDGHCGTRWRGAGIDVPAEARQASAGGDLGVLLAREEGGAAVVVHASASAERAGVRVGDVVEQVDGVTLGDWLADDPRLQACLRFADPCPATGAHLDAERLRWASCGPPGATRTLRLRRNGRSIDHAVTLVAEPIVDGSAQPQTVALGGPPAEDAGAEITHRVVRGADGRHVGVLRVPDFASLPGRVRMALDAALSDWRAAKVCGLVIDMRGNGGGSDK